MKEVRTLRFVSGVGLVWAALWIASVIILWVVIGLIDPDSIDPGESALMAAAIFGPMGFFSGVAFGILRSIWGRGRSDREIALLRAAGWGVLGSAFVQLAYLGHGDLGLIANLKMALLFSAFGGVVAVAWLALARGWLARHSSPRASA